MGVVFFFFLLSSYWLSCVLLPIPRPSSAATVDRPPLLRVDDGGGATFKPLPLAASSTLEVGDATYAIGNPFGLDHTLTSGIVSALDRRIDAPDGYAIDHVSGRTRR